MGRELGFMAKALACALSIALAPAWAGGLARATITAFGAPVLEVDAALVSSASGDWEGSVVDLRIRALISLDGSTIASDASSRMRSGFDLPEAKARRFEDGLAALLGSVPAGGSMSARCAPGTSLTVGFDGRSVEVGDDQTRRAFCGLWLSESGQESLRAGLGFK